MASTAFKTYTQEHGGRVFILFLLFLLALYQLSTSGIETFAIICFIPLLFILAIVSFKYKMFLFWVLIVINYTIQMKDFPLPIPTSLPNEMLQILLIALAVIDVTGSNFNRAYNLMLFTLMIWCGFITLECLNDTCRIGIDVAAWYSGARMAAFQLIYVFLVFVIYISNPQKLDKYLLVWAILALFASFWVWKQKTYGFTAMENGWIQTRGRATHILQGGSLIRYFSIYSDAANFGIGIASTAIAFIIFGITSKIYKLRMLYLLTGIVCIWAMFQSGTRTATFCLFAGFMAYIFLSKSFKIAIPFTIIFILFAGMLAFTDIGNGNQQIRRMRSAFDPNDASSSVRATNRQTMQKYLKDAPWGIGIGNGYGSVPANNKFNLLSNIPADSEYVYLWIRTGIIGITLFLILTAVMLAGACWIVLFKLESQSLRGIGAGLCCAFISQQLGAYGNQVLMQFPNGLVFYGGLSIVYILPHLEKEWIEFENKKLTIQEEKKRIRFEKIEKMRVKPWYSWLYKYL